MFKGLLLYFVKMQSPVKRPNICLIYVKEKLLVSNIKYMLCLMKTSKIYTFGVY